LKRPIIIKNSPTKPHVPGNPIFPKINIKKVVAKSGIKKIIRYNKKKVSNDIVHIKIQYIKINHLKLIHG